MIFRLQVKPIDFHLCWEISRSIISLLLSDSVSSKMPVQLWPSRVPSNPSKSLLTMNNLKKWWGMTYKLHVNTVSSFGWLDDTNVEKTLVMSIPHPKPEAQIEDRLQGGMKAGTWFHSASLISEVSACFHGLWVSMTCIYPHFCLAPVLGVAAWADKALCFHSESFLFCFFAVLSLCTLMINPIWFRLTAYNTMLSALYSFIQVG